MQTPFLHLHKSFISSPPSCQNHNLCSGFQNGLLLPSIFNFRRPNGVVRRRIVAQSYKPNDGNSRPGNKSKATLKGNKDNTWSVDNEIAENEKRKRKPRGRRRGKRLAGGRKGRILVSGAMLMETETLLQTQVSIYASLLKLVGISDF